MSISNPKSEPIAPSDFGLDQRLLGSATLLEPHAPCDSASRAAMRAGFYTQMLVLEGADKRRIVSGAEREYGKYTMHIAAPCDLRVIKVLQKYPKSRGIYDFKHNPETTIIYESLENGEIGALRVYPYHWNHKVFGFRYRYTDAFRNLSIGTILKKDTILAQSYTVQENGEYHYGIETKTAFMTVPGIIEDGIIISESYAKRCRSKGYGSRVIEWGQEYYPLNLYGKDDDEYKIIPDIGDKIRSDGIVCALRKHDPVLAVCHMTKQALRTVNHTFDKLHYVALSTVDDEEPPVVEDISVLHTHNTDLHRTPDRMKVQVEKYSNSIRAYNTEINTIYEEHLRKRGENLKISKEFHNLIIEARKNDNNIQKAQLPKSIARTVRRSKLDDYRVQVTYSWNITPTVSHKQTCNHGGKGVVCAVWKDEWMPVDTSGTRAEMIVDGEATHRRTNYGKFAEHYINATTAHVEKLCGQYIREGKLLEAKDTFLKYISIVSPKYHQAILEECCSEQELIEAAIDEVSNGIQVWLPHDTPNIGVECAKDLMEAFPLPSSPVTYRGTDGKYVTTTKDVLIGTIYNVTLEKVGDDWGATSIPKRQHHGIPGKLTDTDKASLPWRDQAFKVFGESETRLLLGVLEPTFVSSVINFPNSPAMCMDAARTILTAEHPTNIHMAMDYRAHSELQGRSSQYFKHILSTSGVKIVQGVPNE